MLGVKETKRKKKTQNKKVLGVTALSTSSIKRLRNEMLQPVNPRR